MAASLAPVATRELVVASRLPINWRVRLGMTLAALVIAIFALTTPRTLVSAGQNLFTGLATLTFIYALTAGFLFTTTSISDERREGTFGLLFLTPLKSWDIIIGKLASSSLQAVFGLIAIIPVLGLSLLAGGVTGNQFARTVLILLLTLFVSLSAGMFASAAAESSKAAYAYTCGLVFGLLGGAWIGLLLASAVVFASAKEKRTRANVLWIGAYALILLLHIWLMAKTGRPFTSSPVNALIDALNPVTSTNVVLIGAIALSSTSVFYLFSATLCTEWFRKTREIVPHKEEVTTHIDDTFFPGLRSKGRVGNDPAHWLLNFLQSPPLLFYISLALMLLVNLGYGHAPAFGVSHFFGMFIGLLPYAAFNFAIARYCITPFHLLERSGFMETLLTTPIRREDIVRAQRRILWRTLKLPFIFLVLAAVPASIRFGLMQSSFNEISSRALSLYALNWIAGWALFAVHLEALALVAMLNAIRGCRPLNATLRSVLFVLTPKLLVSAFFAPVTWSFAFARSGEISLFFAVQLVYDVFLAWFYFSVIQSTCKRLGLTQPTASTANRSYSSALYSP